MDKKIEQKHQYINIAVLCLSVVMVFIVAWTFTGKWPWVISPYNSYMLQAKAWLEGRLDLGQNYPHLELAIFNDRYFVSFPPFPSLLMLPFALINYDTADGVIAMVAALAAVVYAYKIMKFYEIDDGRAMFWSFFLTIGSNWLLTAQVAWVWFIAQNLAFTLSLMALYYSLKGKLGFSLACWACSVGCRPFQFLYLPIILYLFYSNCKQKNPEYKLGYIVKKNLLSIIPMLIIALSYMALNFARFGNPLEFGHNYLPEFTAAKLGQFNIGYMKENIAKLIRLPGIHLFDKWQYQQKNGFNLFLCSPIFISYIIYTVYGIIKKKTKLLFVILIFASIIIELLCITAHRTMGADQFGNRYTNDVLPMAFLGLAVSIPAAKNTEKLNYLLFFWGFAVNLIGSVLFFTW